MDIVINGEACIPFMEAVKRKGVTRAALYNQMRMPHSLLKFYKVGSQGFVTLASLQPWTPRNYPRGVAPIERKKKTA